MLELLFIEDDAQAVRSVQNLIERENADIQYKLFGFEAAKEKIESLRPDIIILDILINGTSPESEPEGLNIFDFIWAKHFCPIVVYSAQPDRLDDKHQGHPFVKRIRKGRGSPQKVLKALGELSSHVETLKETESHIRQSLACAMRDVAPYVFETLTENDRRVEMVKLASRRRLAAQMDEISGDGTKLAGWEQYLCPPICEDARLGDILRQKDGTDTDPTAFRVVLTPSCDLVSSDGRIAKVRDVLVARCHSIGDGIKLTSWKGIGIPKLRERLPGTLTQGYFETVIPFPNLKNRIPTMAANLKDLELIPFDKIGTEFLRIASLDSPFRELVAWAYLQTAGRPGLPERDIKSWSEEIINAYNNNSRNNNS